MICLSDAYLEARIVKLKVILEAYEDAIIFLLANPSRSYKLDTGQSTQEVNRFDIKKMQENYDSTFNTLTSLEARLCGAALTIRASW
ncbi:hypothetical protein KAR91_64015 [Candidatus Pacearchaeota archaeon]|nr:hypothetical protein [Candidatus Pacearchaeota archaeon]